MRVFEDSKMYDQKEAAPIMKKSVSWFERQRWAGGGPRFIKVGRSCLYLGKDLNEWLESQTRSNTGQEG